MDKLLPYCLYLMIFICIMLLIMLILNSVNVHYTKQNNDMLYEILDSYTIDTIFVDNKKTSIDNKKTSIDSKR